MMSIDDMKVAKEMVKPFLFKSWYVLEFGGLIVLSSLLTLTFGVVIGFIEFGKGFINYFNDVYVDAISEMYSEFKEKFDDA